MSIIEKLAISLGRRDEKPNTELAKKIAAKKDKSAVKELIALMRHKNKGIQFDSIKVLYEIGTLEPVLLKDHIQNFITLLSDKNNRNVWGAMCALDKITLADPKTIYNNLSKIMDAAEKGSVITKDNAVSILLKLCTLKQYAENAFTLFTELLSDCPTNQLPMYAENAVGIINTKNKTAFTKILHSRLDEIEKETKRKRVEKVIRKMDKI